MVTDRLFIAIRVLVLLTESTELEGISGVDDIYVSLQFQPATADILVMRCHCILKDILDFISVLIENGTWNKKYKIKL